MSQIKFTVNIIGFNAREATALLVGSQPLYSKVMQDMVPELATVEPQPAARVSKQSPHVYTRIVRYELDPMVWEPLRIALQTAAPGAIRYTDTLVFAASQWRFVAEWDGVPGIRSSCIKVSGQANAVDDGPFGCVVHYECNVECTLPLVSKLVEQTICQGFKRTCDQIPQVMQKYYVMWNSSTADSTQDFS